MTSGEKFLPYSLLTWLSVLFFFELALLAGGLACGSKKSTTSASTKPPPSLTDGVKYTVTFKSTWSSITHPTQFPPNPHFSGLVGAVHDNRASLWKRGETASPGMELMAETGGKGILLSEVEDLMDEGSALYTLSGPGLSHSPGETTLELTLSQDYPLVTLVSMLAPSPDWFVGVSALNLFESGQWVSSMAVDLRVYDAGTDSGATFTSPNRDSNELITPTDLKPYRHGLY